MILSEILVFVGLGVGPILRPAPHRQAQAAPTQREELNKKTDPRNAVPDPVPGVGNSVEPVYVFGGNRGWLPLTTPGPPSRKAEA